MNEVNIERAVTVFCDSVMYAFASALNVAHPTSPLGSARRGLGERFNEVVIAAMRTHTLRVIENPPDCITDACAVPGLRRVAFAALIADVVASVTTDVIAASAN